MPERESRRRRERRDEAPLGAYTALTTLFGAGVAGLLAWSSSRHRLPARVSARDTLLIGLATHKVARIIAVDKVTRSVRAPFVEEAPASAGGTREVARGRGLQKALGQLVTCPYCLAPWVAGAFLAAYTVSPPAARMVATLFATVAVSDAANHAYLALIKAERHAGEHREHSAPAPTADIVLATE